MQTYNLLYLCTGRLVKDRDGQCVTVRANTERGAKMQFTKALYYVNWNLHSVVLAD